jgi:Fn3 associated
LQITPQRTLRGSYFGSTETGVSQLEADQRLPLWLMPPLHKLVKSLSGRVVLCLVSITVFAAPLWAQKNAASLAGVAWAVNGSWRVDGKDVPIRTGDSLQPGSLLLPDPTATPHRMIVLLPDGQRAFYECFTVEDCARGFRVASLYRDPEAFAVATLARIGAALLREDRDSGASSDLHPPSGTPRDEILAVLGPGNQVQVGGLASNLPNGRFTLYIRPLDPARPGQLHLVVDKTTPLISFPLPSAGLYLVTVRDELNRPRIHLFLAAIDSAQEASFKKSFLQMKQLMHAWDDDFNGWPIHDFQWAYLESLVTQPAGDAPGASPELMAGNQSAANRPPAPGVTAEPTFSPKPGLLDGDTNIVLQCETPGAVIHFTVNPSQPTAISPVYRAPIVVKSGGIDIKAFASAPGKKDSAVVTAIFRMRK